jgi:hypothetical protein
MYPPDRARAHRTAAPPEGDRRVHPVQVVSSQLPQSDLAQVGHQVVIREVAVQGYRPRLVRCFPVSHVCRYSPTVRLWTPTSTMNVRTSFCSALWAAPLVGYPALLVCSRVPLLSRPYSSVYRQLPLHRWGANEPSDSRGQSRV